MPEPLPDDPDILRATAEQVAREAADHLRGLPAPREAGTQADPGGAVWTKSSPTDVVTESDASVERFLRDRLAALRPGEPVYGEEQGDGGDPGSARWVLDPIDGTVNYLYGLPWYAISVAAVRNGRSIAGAVAEPASGRVWSAALGRRGHLRRRRAAGRPRQRIRRRHSSAPGSPTAPSGGSGRRAWSPGCSRGSATSGAPARRRSTCARSPAGWLDGYVEHGCHWWDWAAAALIAAEAGAVLGIAGGPDDLGPGAPGTTGPGGLGADVSFAAAPGVAAALAELARAHGAADV